jgi:energy-coupling factor transport system permease protein
MTYDFYIQRDTFLHRLDPRVKFVITLGIIIAAFLMETLVLLVALMVLLHLVLFASKIPFNRIRSIWKMMLPVNIMIILLWPIFSREGTDVLFSIGSFPVTLESLLHGVAMAVRINILGFACFVLLLTTDQSTIVLGLVKIGLPYDWGLTLAVSLRYLPTFYGIITMVTEAQKTRGLDLEKGSYLTRLKSYMPIIVSVIITGLRSSSNLANALETRAFGIKRQQRTFLHELKMGPADYAALSIFVCLIAALAVSRIVYGYGSELLHVLPQL